MSRITTTSGFTEEPLINVLMNIVLKAVGKPGYKRQKRKPLFTMSRVVISRQKIRRDFILIQTMEPSALDDFDCCSDIT
jgi:hypothetical protein